MSTVEGEKGTRVSNGREYTMPDVGPGQYLVDIWNDIGRFRPSSAGPVGLTAIDLDAYARVFQLPFETWEARAVIDMSEAFLWGLSIGTNALSYSPVEIAEGS